MPSSLNVQFFLTQTTFQRNITTLESDILCDNVFSYPQIHNTNLKEALNITRALFTFTEDLLKHEKNSKNVTFHPLTVETKYFVLGSIRFPFRKCLLILFAKKEENKQDSFHWKGFELPVQNKEKKPLTLLLRCILHRLWHHFFLFYNQEHFHRYLSFETLVENYIAHFVPRFFSNPNIVKFTLTPYHVFPDTQNPITRPMCTIINLRLWNFIYQLKTLQPLKKKGSTFHSGCMFYKDYYMGGTIEQSQAVVIYDCLFQSNQTSQLLSGWEKKDCFNYKLNDIPCFYNLCDQPEEIKERITNGTWIGYLYGIQKTKVTNEKTSESREFVNELLIDIEKDLLVIPKIFTQKSSGLYLIVFKYEDISFLMLFNQLPLDDCVTLQSMTQGIFGTSIALSSWFFLLTKFLCDEEFGLPIFLKTIRSALPEERTQDYNSVSSTIILDNVQKWSNLLFNHTSMSCMNKNRVQPLSVVKKRADMALHQEKNILWILYNIFNFPYSETLQTISVRFKNTAKISLHQDFQRSFSYHIGEKQTNDDNGEDEFLNKTILEHF